jgi:ribosome-associated heat shock protein Hsp15
LDTAQPREDVRLDVWLDVACVFRTRSEAQKACRGGKVKINGQTVKPNRVVRPGDELVIARPLGRIQRLVVRTVTDRQLPKAEARLLYEDVTPPPTAQELEQRRLERIYRATVSPRAPDKRERRLLRRITGKD